MKRKLPETLPFIIPCVALGFCFQIFFVIDSYATNKERNARESIAKNTFIAGALLQNRVVTGTVVDNDSNEAIPGVSILIKGMERCI